MNPALQEVAHLFPLATWGPLLAAGLLAPFGHLLLERACRLWFPRRATAHPEHWTEFARRMAEWRSAWTQLFLAEILVWTYWCTLHPSPFSVLDGRVLAAVAVFSLNAAALTSTVSSPSLSLQLLFGPFWVTWVAMVLLLPPDGPGFWLGAPAGVAVLLSTGSMLHLPILMRAGLLRPAPDWLAAAIDQPIWVAPSGTNVFALPTLGCAVVPETVLEALSEAQVIAVLEHEAGHLEEPRSVLIRRLAGMLPWCAVAFWRPLIVTTGFIGLVAVVALTLLPKLGFNRLSRRLEEEADDHVTDREALATALERLHRLGAHPAVTNGDTTHPHLYDRLTRLGHPPPYGRPAPPYSKNASLPAFTFGIAVILSAFARSTFAGPMADRGSLDAWLALGEAPTPVLEEAAARAETAEQADRLRRAARSLR